MCIAKLREEGGKENRGEKEGEMMGEVEGGREGGSEYHHTKSTFVWHVVRTQSPFV